MNASAVIEREQVVEAGDAAEKGRCLLIRMDPILLVVPRTLVAEVVRHEGTALMDTAHPDVKQFNWRGFQVPLLNSAVINPACTLPPTGDSKIILFYGLLNHGKLPWYAFVASRNPRLVKATENSVLACGDQQDLLATESARVTIDDETAIIPKVDYLERFILDHCFAAE